MTTTLRGSIRSIAVLAFGAFGGAALGFLTQVAIGRALSPDGLGRFSAALATVTITAPLAGFGLHGFWLKAFGQEGWHAQRWLSVARNYAVVSTLLAGAILFGWTLGVSSDSSGRLVYTLSPLIIAQFVSDFSVSKLLLENAHGRVAAMLLLPHALRAVLVVGVTLWCALTAESVAVIYAIAALVVIAYGVPQVRDAFAGRMRLVGHAPRPSGSPVSIVEDTTHFQVLSESLPFGAAGVFFFAHLQGSLIVLSFLADASAAGVFAAASTLLSAIYILPNTIFQRFLLPRAHRLAAQDPGELLSLFRFTSMASLIVGVVAGVVLALVARPVVFRLYGAAFAQTATILSILAVAVPLRYLATSVGMVLVTSDNMRRKTKYMGMAALVNVVVTAALAPFSGAAGAAYALVASELTLLLAYVLAVRAFVFGDAAWRGWTLRLPRTLRGAE